MSVRSLKPVYDVGVMVEALPRVLEEAPDARLLIVGEGSQREMLIARAQQLKVTSHVEFIPPLSHEQIPDYYRRADIYVSASRSDGLCVSLLEAMASGLFPIVSDIPGNRELVEDGVNGSLFPVGDEEALGQSIVEIITHPQRIPEAIQRNTDLIVTRFEEQLVMGQAERVYKNLLVSRDVPGTMSGRFAEN
jgi:glycosyltransferase involved in cell wall biosynthesis